MARSQEKTEIAKNTQLMFMEPLCPLFMHILKCTSEPKHKINHFLKDLNHLCNRRPFLFCFLISSEPLHGIEPKFVGMLLVYKGNYSWLNVSFKCKELRDYLKIRISEESRVVAHELIPEQRLADYFIFGFPILHAVSISGFFISKKRNTELNMGKLLEFLNLEGTK